LGEQNNWEFPVDNCPFNSDLSSPGTPNPEDSDFSQTASLWWGSPYTKFLKIQLATCPAKHFWPAGVSIL
jgi:hypothetical protein